MKIFLFICLLLSFNTIYSQDGYTWQNPIPTSIYAVDIEFISPNVGWIAGLAGSIIKTTDGGDTWVHQFSAPETINKISFYNENIGIAVGENGFIVKTTNGGTNWERKKYGTKRFYAADLIDENTYVIGGSEGIIKSTNGGSSWSFCSRNAVLDIMFYDENFGIAVDNYSSIFKTTDGGKTWNTKTINNGSYRKINFIDKNNIIIAGGNVMRSSDKGETWFSLNADPNMYYNDIYFKNLNNGVLLSSDVILKTTNGGLTWITDSIRFWSGSGFNYSRELGYLNDSTFIVTGIPGIIVKTTNAGTTWELKTKGFLDDITKVHFLNEKDGFVTTKTGNIYVTKNSGTNWVKLDIDNTLPLENISFLDEKNGVVVGNGVILLTSDNGANWNKIAQPYYDILAAQYIDENNIVCVSHNALLKTSDKGSTWYVNFVPKNDIIDVHFKDANNGIIFGYKNFIKTSDGGNNWETIDLVPGDNEYYSRVLFRNETGYIKVSISNNYDSYLKTIDGGENWERVYPPVSGIMAMANESTISIYNGTYSYTTINGGTNWYRTITFYNANDWAFLKDFNLVSAQQGYLVGDGGMIVRINPMFIPTDVESFTYTPIEFSLSQNYPNPLNPTTKINYTIANDGRASLIIYDVLGREVQKLFDEEKSKGNYSVEFNASELSSGIYFYRLNVDGFSETKKMVLMK